MLLLCQWGSRFTSEYTGPWGGLSTDPDLQGGTFCLSEQDRTRTAARGTNSLKGEKDRELLKQTELPSSSFCPWTVSSLMITVISRGGQLLKPKEMLLQKIVCTSYSSSGHRNTSMPAPSEHQGGLQGMLCLSALPIEQHTHASTCD